VRTLAPVHFGALARIVVFIFFALFILWGVANYVVLKDVLLSWVVVAINGLLALVLGWLFYKRMRHTIFSYDQDGFEVRMGRRLASGQWRDFSGVSLVHLGYGSFAVRLYKDQKASLDIPASSLRLDPSEFRFEVMRLVSGEPDKG
jgi:hypothetical protein